MDQDKENAPYRLGLTLLKIIESNTAESELNNQKYKSINSLRKLAAASRVEYSIVQKISSAKRNPSFSTIVNLVDGFNLTFSEFASRYDAISEEDVLKYKRELVKKKEQKILKKKKTAKKKSSKKK